MNVAGLEEHRPMAVHKLRGLEYLVAVVDSGGFNAAARQLGVAAPRCTAWCRRWRPSWAWR